MGKSSKRRQAKRAKDGAGAMEVDKPMASADLGVADMDTSEVVARPKGLSQNKLSRKSTKRRAVNVRKKKAAEKAMAMSEKQKHKAQQDVAKVVRKNSLKKLY